MPKTQIENIKVLQAEGKKAFAVLIDPDKVDLASLPRFLKHSVEKKVSFFLVGGSLITSNTIKEIVTLIKATTPIPAILFPGNSIHIEDNADAILFLSLISGRNPEFLIGQHVIAAPIIKNSQLEVLPTGYMLIDSGKQTTVSYISNTTPIPHDKPSIAACTAMAGEMLGLQLIYMDAGSGAINPVSEQMIDAVKRSVDIPLIIGGGLNTADKAKAALLAGADIIVIGNGIEERPRLLDEVAEIVDELNQVYFIAS